MKTLIRALRDDRAQTTIDFTIGVTLFLVTLTVVFAFLPIPTPGGTTTDTSTASIDRIANTLTGTELVKHGAPTGTLDATCTAAFFNNTDTEHIPDDCRFTTTNLTELTGLDAGHETHITITQNETVRTVNAVALTRGSPPRPDDENIATARRVVTINGDAHRLTIKVWNP
jgi:hypothetical protein